MRLVVHVNTAACEMLFCIVGKYVEIKNTLKLTIGILAIARGTAVVYTCMRAPVNQAYWRGKGK